MTKAALFFGAYEWREVRLIRRCLPRDQDVLELGAGLGRTGAVVLGILEPSCRYIAVEANSDLEAGLVRTLRQAGIRSPRAVVTAAVDGTASPPARRWLQAGEWTEGSRLRDGATSCGRGRTVPAVSLGALLERHDLRAFSLICDVEGAEMSLLLEEPEAFERCEALIVEFHRTRYRGRDLTVRDGRRMLEQLGFHRLGGRGAVAAFGRCGTPTRERKHRG